MYLTRIPNMKKVIFAISTFIFATAAANAAFTSCGPGYILDKHASIDGMNAYECKKLWCMDLENGRNMGSGNTASSGYKSTSAPSQLCDVNGNCVECFGERKWCGGEQIGVWNPEYGAYTRGGADNATYQSYQKGSCFAWRLEKPGCPSGQTAVLVNDQWQCADSSKTTNTRASTIRRTGTIRKRAF